MNDIKKEIVEMKDRIRYQGLRRFSNGDDDVVDLLAKLVDSYVIIDKKALADTLRKNITIEPYHTLPEVTCYKKGESGPLPPMFDKIKTEYRIGEEYIVKKSMYKDRESDIKNKLIGYVIEHMEK